MSKPELIMLVGLPGSGKSTYAQTLKDSHVIHSSDALRKELFGDENKNSKGCNKLVFQTLHKRVKDDLRNGKSVVYDATNLIGKRRAEFLRTIRNVDCYKKCVLIASPFFLCTINNKSRERVVPYSVIERMYKSFNPPYYYEGYDKIDIVLSGNKDWFEDWFKDYTIDILFNCANGIMNFNQNNVHHSYTLGVHCIKTKNRLEEQGGKIELQYAGLLHDIGKVFTQTVLNIKGEADGNCHYYNHNNVGAYDSIFYMLNKLNGVKDVDVVKTTLYVSVLIYYHMHPCNESWNDTESKVKRLKAQLGEELYNDIIALHEADKFAQKGE